MSGIVSVNNYDIYGLIPAKVVVGFDEKGHIVPVRVWLAGEFHKISESKEKTEFLNCRKYECLVEVRDHVVPLQLLYYMQDCLWVMPPLTPGSESES